MPWLLGERYWWRQAGKALERYNGVEMEQFHPICTSATSARSACVSSAKISAFLVQRVLVQTGSVTEIGLARDD